MNKFLVNGISSSIALLLSADAFAKAPEGVANPFNVEAVVNAAVSPDGSGAAILSKRRKIKQLISLRILSQKNIELLTQILEEVKDKIKDLEDKLDDEDSDSDDAEHLKERIKDKEERIEEIEKLKEIFLKGIARLNSQIVSTRAE